MLKSKSGITYLLLLTVASFAACGGATDEEASQSASTGALNKAFIHTATASNISGASTLLDSPLYPELTDPNTKLIVTQRVQFNGLSSSPHNDNVVAVSYNQTEGRWSILNTVGAGIADGTQFNVLIPGPNADVFVQQISSTGSTGGILDHELAADANAKFFITPVFEEPATPISTDATSINYANFLIGNRWVIRRESAAGFSVGERFNVYVAKDTDVVERFTTPVSTSSLQMYTSEEANYSGIQFIVNDTTVLGASFANRNYCVSDLTNIVATSLSTIRNLDNVSNIEGYEEFNVLTVF